MLISKITNIHQSQTAKDSLAGIIGHAAAALSGALFFAVSARLLGPAEFGIFSLAIVSATVIKDLIDPATNAAMLRFASGSKTKLFAQGIYKHFAILKLKYFIIIIPIILLFGRQISLLLFHKHISLLIPLTLALSLTLSIGVFYSGILQAEKRFFADAFFTLSQPLVRLAFMGVLVITRTASIQTLITANIAAYLTVTIIAAYFIKTNFLKAAITQEIKDKSNSFLPAMILSTGVGSLTDKVSLYITNFLTTATQLGLLSAVNRLFIPTQQIAGVLNNVFGSRFSAFKSEKEAKKYLIKSLLLVSALAVGLVVVSSWSQLIISIIYGNQFTSAAVVFRIFALAFAVFLIQVPFSSMLLFYKGRSDLTAKLAITQLFTTLLLGYFFISRFGIIGAALAQVLITSLHLILIIPTTFLATKVKQ